MNSRKIKYLFIFIFLFCFEVQADDFCSNVRDVLFEVSDPSYGQLIGCGIATGVSIDTLDVYQISGTKKTNVFFSDDAFKKYQFKNVKNDIYIYEAFLSQSVFSPFIEIHIDCVKGVCKANDAKVLIKIKKHNKKEKAEILSYIENVSCSHVLENLEKLFVYAAEGNRQAREFFLKKNIPNCKGNVEAGEAFTTLQMDLKRIDEKVK